MLDTKALFLHSMKMKKIYDAILPGVQRVPVKHIFVFANKK